MGIAEVTELIADLFSPRTTPPPDVPNARERVEFMFELWDRRRVLPDSPIDDNMWQRCRQLAANADPVDADRLWLWCRVFAPMAAVSLARRAGNAEGITLMRDLAYAR